MIRPVSLFNACVQPTCGPSPLRLHARRLPLCMLLRVWVAENAQEWGFGFGNSSDVGARLHATHSAASVFLSRRILHIRYAR